MDLLFKIFVATVLMTKLELHSALRLSRRIPRLSVAEDLPSNYYFNNIDGNPGVYSFNYDIADDLTGNSQYRTEDRFSNGTVTGAYGYIDPFGKPQRFRYIADIHGYRVFRDNLFQPYGFQTTTYKPVDKLIIQTEPSITWTRPKRPNKNRFITNEFNYGNGIRRKYNLVGPPSQYAAYN